MKWSQAENFETENLCDYGCANKAKFIFKSGKLCCSPFSTQCPINKKKNRDSLKGNIPSKLCLEKAHNSIRGKRPWNYGLTKENDERVKNISNTLNGRIISGDLKYIGHVQTDETKNKLSVIARKRNLGGYIKGSGRGKKGWYKGYWCDSSWELAYVIFNLEHNIIFKRNTEKFQYKYKNEIKNWIPDFILEDNSYIEIKGYYTDKVASKLKFFKHPIRLLMEKDLTEVFEYVINKYGKDYIKLYEQMEG